MPSSRDEEHGRSKVYNMILGGKRHLNRVDGLAPLGGEQVWRKIDFSRVRGLPIDSIFKPAQPQVPLANKRSKNAKQNHLEL